MTQKKAAAKSRETVTSLRKERARLAARVNILETELREANEYSKELESRVNKANDAKDAMASEYLNLHAVFDAFGVPRSVRIEEASSNPFGTHHVDKQVLRLHAWFMLWYSDLLKEAIAKTENSLRVFNQEGCESGRLHTREPFHEEVDRYR